MHERAWNRIKSSPERLRAHYEYQKKWRDTNPLYRAFLEKQKARLRFQRFVKNYFENPTNPLHRKHQGLVVVFEFGYQHYKITTPIQPLKKVSEYDSKNGKRVAMELELFKLVLEQYLEKRQLENTYPQQ